MQKELNFAGAEGTHAERKNQLGLALMKVEADLFLSHFCLWVFNTTSGGLEGELIKSYSELAARPWGLCCSKSKARATVGVAVHHGLIQRTEHRYVSCGQRANGYSIDWRGLVRILHPRPGALRRHGGVSTEHPHAFSEHGGVSTEHPYKEETTSSGTFSFPEPVPERPPPEPDPVTDQVPELVDAAERLVEPLPAGRLAYGAFVDVTDRTLNEPAWLVAWWRRQLGLSRPLTDDSEASLLLVLAAARYARRMPAAEIRKSRSAVFAFIVSRGKWFKILSHVPAARQDLDGVLEMAPNALQLPAERVRVLGCSKGV